MKLVLPPAPLGCSRDNGSCYHNRISDSDGTKLPERKPITVHRNVLPGWKPRYREPCVSEEECIFACDLWARLLYGSTVCTIQLPMLCCMYLIYHFVRPHWICLLFSFYYFNKDNRSYKPHQCKIMSRGSIHWHKDMLTVLKIFFCFVYPSNREFTDLYTVWIKICVQDFSVHWVIFYTLKVNNLKWFKIIIRKRQLWFILFVKNK